MKPTLYILCGPAGCGKSTYAKALDATVISSDAVREELYGDASIQSNPKRVFSIVNQRVKENLLLGKDVVYDATSLTKDIRANIIRQFDARFVAVWFDVSKKECLKRNAERERKVPERVIEKMFNNFEIPTYDEGFAAIIKIST